MILFALKQKKFAQQMQWNLEKLNISLQAYKFLTFFYLAQTITYRTLLHEDIFVENHSIRIIQTINFLNEQNQTCPNMLLSEH